MAGFYNCLRGRTDCSVMASGLSDVTANPEPTDTLEEFPGKKKSKFQTFKKLFTKKKRKEPPLPAGESVLKSSQSSDDVTVTEPIVIQSDPNHDPGSKVNMGNKAMSHDSVFVSDSPSSETNDGVVSSQESIHGKVKSLQLQLKQAIRVGSPPALICPKRAEDAGALSEDDGLPHSPPEMSTLHTVLTGSSHRSPNPVQRSNSLSLEGSDSDDDQMPCEAASLVSQFIPLPADFSQPASPAACLDSSAARHRIAVKHKACAKRKPASREILESSKPKVLGGTQKAMEDQLSVVISEPSSEELKDITMEQTDAGGDRTEGARERTEAQLVSSVSPLSQMSDEPTVTVHLPAGELEEQSAAQDLSDKGSQPQNASSSSSLPSSSENEFDTEDILPASDPEHQQSLQTPALASLEPPAGHSADPVLGAGCEADHEGAGSLLEEVLSTLSHPCTPTHAAETDDAVLEVHSVCCVGDGLAEDSGSSFPASHYAQGEEPSPLNPEGPSLPELEGHCIDENPKEEHCEELGKCLQREDVDPPEDLAEGEHELNEPKEDLEGEGEEPDEEGEDLNEDGQELDEEEEGFKDNGEELVEEGEDLNEDGEELDEEEDGFKDNGEELDEEGEDLNEDGIDLDEEEEEGLKDNGEELDEEGEDVSEDREALDQEGEGLNKDEEEGGELEEEETEVKEEGEDLKAKPMSVSCEQESSAWLKEELASLDSTGEAGSRSDIQSDCHLECDSITTLQCIIKQSAPVQNKEGSNCPPQPLSTHSMSTPEWDQPMAFKPSLEEHSNTTVKSSALGSEILSVLTESHNSVSQTKEDLGKQGSSSRVRFTIAPAWQRSLSGGASKEPHFALPVDPEAFEESSGARNLPHKMTDRKEEPLSPVKDDSQSGPNSTQCTASLPLPQDPSPQETGSAENPFGIRLRRTSALLRYCGSATFEVPGNTAPSMPIEPQPPTTKPPPPKKPDPQDDTTAKAKKTPELVVGRAPEGEVATPSWISVARQKQKVFKENSLDETACRKSTSEKDEPQRKISLPVSISQTKKDQPKPSSSSTAASCSWEISTPAIVEKEGKRPPSCSPPSSLGQDEPPWMALAKKKAKAWSEMPQIVQ